MNKGVIDTHLLNHLSMISQDINLDKATVDFVTMMQDDNIIKVLKLDTLFDNDKEKQDKDKDMIKLIHGIFEPNPTLRMYPHDLLALKVFDEQKEETVKLNNDDKTDKSKWR